MGRIWSVALGAVFSFVSTTFVSTTSADTLPLALTAPVPVTDTDLPQLPPAQFVSFTQDAPMVDQAGPVPFAGRIAKQADISAFGFACEDRLAAYPVDGAMIQVRVAAPCRPNERVEIRYNGVSFDSNLTMTGEAHFTLPALDHQAEIDTVFRDGSARSASVRVAELEGYARVAVAWASAESPELTGHAPRQFPVDMVTLGDGSGRVLQVVSHQIDPDARVGVIRLTLAERITEANCDKPQTGHVVQRMPNLPPLRYDLALASPGCDRIGTNLELKNVLQDLKLAAN